jgi:hypothetical protein
LIIAAELPATASFETSRFQTLLAGNIGQGRGAEVAAEVAREATGVGDGRALDGPVVEALPGEPEAVEPGSVETDATEVEPAAGSKAEAFEPEVGLAVEPAQAASDTASARQAVRPSFDRSRLVSRMARS